jgi:uncharacterized repeat protein (TIGR03803 family)
MQTSLISKALLMAFLTALLSLATPLHAASGESVLYNFCSQSECTDGAVPEAGLIFDSSGNLYGTTSGLGGDGLNFGNVFRLTLSNGAWTESVLYNFCSASNCADGEYPIAGLIFDAKGNLYGTTEEGGSQFGGVVFELTPTPSGFWTETVLYNFNGTYGSGPAGSVVFDKNGNLYGTSFTGGTFGVGMVFELTLKSGVWTEKTLHSFDPNGKDGTNPASGVIFDAAGNLYGITIYGGPTKGCLGEGCGVVWELSKGAGGVWTEKILHSFTNNGKDGFFPQSALILDASNNLYGTTYNGGSFSYGMAFELAPTSKGTWAETILHSFCSLAGCRDGANPDASLIFDSTGKNLYGTTEAGGTGSYGIAFELSPATNGKWTDTVLHNFNYGDGLNPLAPLIFDGSGNLYGTTYEGGTSGSGCFGFGCGTVFEITPAKTY